MKTSTIVKKNVKALFLDFDEGVLWNTVEEEMKISINNIDSSFISKNDYEYVLIQYTYTSKRILDILYFSTILTRVSKVFLVTEAISDSEIFFFKKRKLSGIISKNDIRNLLEYLPQSRHSEFFIGKDFMINNSVKNSNLELFKLSTSEMEILYFISKGFNNVEISNKIHKSYHTIKNHKTNIALKAGMESCRHLLSFALNPNPN